MKMSDQDARRQAVDVNQSVLVQAPAGSGKTTLLVERYIRLLACVEEPEQILAITFTRKAASEMRRRILSYLMPRSEPWETHELELKESVAAISHKVTDWNLINNPQRMQIRTIDSFCHFLARTMPISGQLGPVPKPLDQAQRLYRAAARQALQGETTSEEQEAARAHLLMWCDHQHHQVETLLAQLLARREQWLPIISSGGHFDRNRQDHFLALIVERHLYQTHSTWCRSMTELRVDDQALWACCREAARCLHEADKHNPLVAINDIVSLPSADSEDLPKWRALAFLMLTKSGGFRSRLTVNEGFPPKCKHKDVFQSILTALASVEGLAELLHQASLMPNPHYSDDEWQTLEALVTVLRLAASHLELLFAQIGQSDFTALSTAALRGLGDEESGYSDLALYLDQVIQHILVDEYQDTNWTQFKLLEKLTQAWDEESHRTLFLVGDPMQSIYRFREAEVGLFIKTREQGLHGKLLVDARLTRNFRSSQSIVDWVNNTLGPLFPTEEDISSGAIAYAHSEPTQAKAGRIQLHSYASSLEEARGVADYINDLLDQNKDREEFSIAVIVRARSHLQHLIPRLQEQGIPFRALKLDKLIDRPVIQDLMALTKAILNPQDRTAIIALLRSPLVGLTLAELITFAQETEDPLSKDSTAALTEGSKARADQLFEALDASQSFIGRRPLADLVEGAWCRLGGPIACMPEDIEKRTTETNAYLDALAQAETNDLVHDWNDFSEWIDGTHSEGDGGSSQIKVDILTMHGAKGLEWDAVIIPSLHSKPRRSDSELMYWLPFPVDDNDQGILMAPMSASTEKDSSARVDLIKREQSLRQEYELLRLMYVATTRAKSSLLLSATIDPEEASDYSPPSGSLLETIWPTTQTQFVPVGEQRIQHDEMAGEETGSHMPSDQIDDGCLKLDQTIYRLPDEWSPQWDSPIPSQSWTAERSTKEDIEFNWAGSQARRNGTVLHKLLEWVGEVGCENLGESDIDRICTKIPTLLRQVGTDAKLVDALSQSLGQTFKHVISSQVGRWILSAQHEDAHCEYPLSGFIDGAFINAIIDRTFIDVQGTRWIIDYKSGYHEGGDLEAFLDQEADRYREQLSLYARLFKKLGAHKISTALYLPRHDRLKVIDEP